MRKRFKKRLGFLLILLCLLAQISSSSAHNGPPFPVAVDKLVGPYKVSLWADPDIGVGTLYVMLESPGAGSLTQTPNKVEIAVQPVSKRLPEKIYPAERQTNYASPQYIAQVPFDKQELWRLRVLLHDTNKTEEIVAQAEATPDDLGALGILLYGFPFLAIGFLWIKATLKQKRKQTTTHAG